MKENMNPHTATLVLRRVLLEELPPYQFPPNLGPVLVHTGKFQVSYRPAVYIYGLKNMSKANPASRNTSIVQVVKADAAGRCARGLRASTNLVQLCIPQQAARGILVHISIATQYLNSLQTKLLGIYVDSKAPYPVRIMLIP